MIHDIVCDIKVARKIHLSDHHFSFIYPHRSAQVTSDKLQELWKMHKKTPVVVLFGRVVWCIGDFFKSYLPEAMKRCPDSTKGSYRFNMV